MHFEKSDLVSLVMRAGAGDTRAFDCLVTRYQDAAVGYARAQLRGDPIAGEDAAQEAFLQAWRNLPDLREPAAFPSWLRRIVFKYCDRVRRSAPQPRHVSLDAAWAYLHLANTLACDDDPAGAVLAYDAFERWLPGRAVRLCTEWPNYPVSSADPDRPTYSGEEIRLRVLANSGEFADAWRRVWRTDEYLERMEAALGLVAATANNRYLRFVGLRVACYVCERSGRFEAGDRFVARMFALADESDFADDDRAYWQAEALGHEARMRDARGDAAGAADSRDRKAKVLMAHGASTWALGQRHELANSFVGSGEYDRALALLDRNVSAGGYVNAWGYALHGIATWAATADRPRTLALLRDAAVRESSDLRPIVLNRPEFAGVRDDPEFIEALRMPD